MSRGLLRQLVGTLTDLTLGGDRRVTGAGLGRMVPVVILPLDKDSVSRSPAVDVILKLTTMVTRVQISEVSYYPCCVVMVCRSSSWSSWRWPWSSCPERSGYLNGEV